MVTRDLLKEEIDKVQDRYLEVLYRIVKALENPSNSEKLSTVNELLIPNWKGFVEATYGCMTNDPIESGEQKQGRRCLQWEQK